MDGDEIGQRAGGDDDAAAMQADEVWTSNEMFGLVDDARPGFRQAEGTAKSFRNADLPAHLGGLAVGPLEGAGDDAQGAPPAQV